jgi:hypothetical protein
MYFFKARYDFFFNEKLDRMQTQNFYLFILYIYFCIFVSPHLEKKKKKNYSKQAKRFAKHTLKPNKS